MVCGTLIFFVPWILIICLGVNTLYTLALDLLVGVYPLLLMMLAYLLIDVLYDRNFKPLVIIWRPFRAILSRFHRSWEIKTSAIDSFATIFLLSNANILSTCCDLLGPVMNSTGHITHSQRLFYDATIVYFGTRHLPYAIQAIAVFTLFVLMPSVLSILYPFHWFSPLFPFRWYILHTFMDSFQGCYKEGTERGTRDCWWFVSMFFTMRLIAIAIGVATWSPWFFPITSMLIIIVVILLIIVQPFKTAVSHYTTIIANYLLLSAMFFTIMGEFE